MPSAKWWRWTSSSSPPPAIGRYPFAWLLTSCAADAAFGFGRDQFGPAPPYATGPDVLFVAYYASAELGCYRVLGWPMPERILDLFTEFRARTNGARNAGRQQSARRARAISASTASAPPRRKICGR